MAIVNEPLELQEPKWRTEAAPLPRDADMLGNLGHPERIGVLDKAMAVLRKASGEELDWMEAKHDAA